MLARWRLHIGKLLQIDRKPKAGTAATPVLAHVRAHGVGRSGGRRRARLEGPEPVPATLKLQHGEISVWSAQEAGRNRSRQLTPPEVFFAKAWTWIARPVPLATWRLQQNRI